MCCKRQRRQCKDAGSCGKDPDEEGRWEFGGYSSDDDCIQWFNGLYELTLLLYNLTRLLAYVKMQYSCEMR